MSKNNSSLTQNQILETLFGSRIRIKILKFLFRNYPINFSIKELSRRVQEPIEEVNKELKSLDKVGLIKKA
jgi:predicted transcriptional regulator with HTH domain